VFLLDFVEVSDLSGVLLLARAVLIEVPNVHFFVVLGNQSLGFQELLLYLSRVILHRTVPSQRGLPAFSLFLQLPSHVVAIHYDLLRAILPSFSLHGLELLVVDGKLGRVAYLMVKGALRMGDGVEVSSLGWLVRLERVLGI
jgi:hypothetical protein